MLISDFLGESGGLLGFKGDNATDPPLVVLRAEGTARPRNWSMRDWSQLRKSGGSSRLTGSSGVGG